jgi:general secretion pathway protein D
MTPHVLHDQRDARSLTEDLRQQLPTAAYLPYEIKKMKRGGADDPNLGVQKAFGVGP